MIKIKNWKKKALIPIALFVILLLVLMLMLINIFNTPKNNHQNSHLYYNPPPALAKKIQIKIMTWNVHDLYLASQNRRQRLKAIGKYIARLQPDLIGLQEAFIAADRKLLLQQLKNTSLKYHAYFNSGLVGSGLLTISKFPISEKYFWRYSDGGKFYKVWHGDWWAGKGASLVYLKLPKNLGYLSFYNTHAHAQYQDYYEYYKTRLKQMQELANFSKQTAIATMPSILVGDINSRPLSHEHKTLVKQGNFIRLCTINTGIDHIYGQKNTFYQFQTIATKKIAGKIKVGNKYFALSDHNGYISNIIIHGKR